VARPLRIAFPGALYHVTSRGNARAPIYLDDHDRSRFLVVVQEVVERHHWRCYAYCLMTNHYHLVVDTPLGNLSAGMRQLNGVYTQAFNRRHARVGHLFQGRFSGILVERVSHLLELARYVVLNPVRAGMVGAPEDYRWSSLRATLGRSPLPSWLEAERLLQTFNSPARYLEFVREGAGLPSPWSALRGSVLGSDAFARAHTAQGGAPARAARTPGGPPAPRAAIRSRRREPWLPRRAGPGGESPPRLQPGRDCPPSWASLLDDQPDRRSRCECGERRSARRSRSKGELFRFVTEMRGFKT
jgi:REP element-mobilizing transposase RayT